jgi:DNA-binding transcriptional ArsR family regulator
MAYGEVEESIVKAIMDENRYMPFVESTSMEGSSKWHVMQWLAMTETKVLKYFDLMTQLRPLYDSFSIKYEEQVLEYGQKLIEDLNNGKKFYDITHGLVKDNLYPQGDILISWVQPMEIAIVLSEDKPYLRFGLKIETFLENMKILNENAMVERVTAFKNLGDKTRYSVLKCVASGMDSTKKIAESLGVSSATISYHLNNLLSSRLISYESIEGKVRAQVNKEWIRQVLDEVENDFLNE